MIQTMLLLLLAASPSDGPEVYARFDIHEIGHQRLSELKARPELDWWVELDRYLITLTRTAQAQQIAADHQIAVNILDTLPDAEQLAFVIYPLELNRPARILAESGRYAVIQWTAPARPLREFRDHSHDGHQHGALMPFRPDTVLACQSFNLPEKPRMEKRAAVDDMLARINTTRWFMDVYELQCINRYSRSETIAEARDYLVDQFDHIEGLTVSTQSFSSGNTTWENVVGVLTGTANPEDIYVVGAHYDSISENPNEKAPGAEDNASGTAAVLEMARIFAQQGSPATIIFIAYSAEEIGLIGSSAHVTSLIDDEMADNVRAVLIMVMISFTSDDDLDIVLESSQFASPVVDMLDQAASTYTSLRTIQSFNPFGSDHVPYLRENIPAVLVIQNEYGQYPGYHRTTDVIDNVDRGFAAEVLKMNIATLAEMVGIE